MLNTFAEMETSALSYASSLHIDYFICSGEWHLKKKAQSNFAAQSCASQWLDH